MVKRKLSADSGSSVSFYKKHHNGVGFANKMLIVKCVINCRDPVISE